MNIMGDIAPWILGVLRRGSSVPSVVGEGFTLTAEEFESQHGTFYGSPNINLTGIVIDDISIFPTPDTTPKVIRATLYDCIRWAGTRTYSVFGYPVPVLFTRIRHTDLDFRWEVVYEDDSPIEDSEGILSAFTRENVNPYLDQIGTILSAVGRKAGVGYKIKGYAYGKNGDVIRGASFEKLIPAISDNALPTTFLDWEFGNDANDGKDPLGLSLSGATYDNATRTITLTGGFTTYDHAAATSNNRTQWFNKLYLLSATEPGFTPQLVEIESKTSNDAVVIKQSLGANYTGITSSNGPKLTLQTSGINNTRQCPKLGGNYSISSAISMGNSGVKEFIAWGASGLTDARVIKSTAGAITDFLSNSSADLSGTTWWTFSRVTLDGEYARTLTTGAGTGENGARDAVLFFDRSTLKGSSGGQTFGYNFSGALQYEHKIKLMFYGSLLDNLPDPLGTNNKTNGMYCVNNLGAWFTFLGSEVKSSDYTNVNLHHFVYMTVSMSNAHIAFTRGVESVEGANSEYVFNLNMLEDSQNISVVRNYFGDGAKRGMDLSITNDNSDVHYADDVYVVDNDFSTYLTGIYQYSCRTIRAAFNRYWRSDNAGTATFFKWDGNPLWMGADFEPRIWLDGNKVYGAKLTDDDTNRAYYETANNQAYHGADNYVARFGDGTISTMESKFDNNNFYAPNKTDGTILRVGSENITLEAFNTLTGGVNISEDPGWIDPANGDFSTLTETYFTDFSTDTIGQLPANTTLKRNAVAGDYQVVDQSGTKVLRYLATTGSGQRGLAFPLESSGVVEIYTEIMEGNAGLFRSTVYAIDSPVDEYGGLLSDDVNILQTFRRGSGTFSQIASVGYNVLPDRYYALLFKVTPGSPNTIQAKAWDLSLGETEPVSWMLSNTNSNLTLVNGWLGLGASTLNVTGYCRKIGIGINGQPAPRS